MAMGTYHLPTARWLDVEPHFVRWSPKDRAGTDDFW
jgi:hypothetical protein